MSSPRDTHGPLVKTGPTARKVRSKNQDGQWRAKRSDAGKTRGNKESNKSDSPIKNKSNYNVNLELKIGWRLKNEK